MTGRPTLRKPPGAATAGTAQPRSTRAKLAQRARHAVAPTRGEPALPASPAATAARHAPAADGRVRVSKLMSERGLCSRREADEYIERGWVYVDGLRVDELGTRVDPSQTITLDRRAGSLSKVTILLHKPVGYVSGQAEDGYKPAVTLVLPENRFTGDNPAVEFSRAHLRGLAPAGRLDIDSTGLLVLTQDGRIAKLLIGDDSQIEKEYLVRVEGRLDREGLARLNHGLSLDGVVLRPAKVSWQNEDQLRFVLREGRKRQIRRMCELVGLKVVGLKRIRIGRIPLGRLPAGQWRYLGPHEKF
ncbi:MAG TPA: pseudouridine synthase [Burkholderiales bacterium]|nr:pseudouridine synthase [Burkholderiales bacterium]